MNGHGRLLHTAFRLLFFTGTDGLFRFVELHRIKALCLLPHPEQVPDSEGWCPILLALCSGEGIARVPMLLCLHGGSERENNLEQLIQSGFPQYFRDSLLREVRAHPDG